MCPITPFTTAKTLGSVHHREEAVKHADADADAVASLASVDADADEAFSLPLSHHSRQ